MAASRESELRRWWGKRVNDVPIQRVEELPDPGYARDLAALGLAHLLGRSVLVLGRPGETLETLLRARFWETVCVVLAGYEPYAVGGVSALRLWSDDLSIPKAVEIWTRSSSARLSVGDLAVLRLEKRPDLFGAGPARTTRRPVRGPYMLSIDSPESLLTGLRPAALRDAPDLVSAFLKGARFEAPRLRELCATEGKPAKLARLALMLRRLGRDGPAQDIEQGVLAGLPSGRPLPRVSLAARLPAELDHPASLADAPSTARFRDQLRLYARAASDSLKGLSLPRIGLTEVLDRARRGRQYDAYHSSTIEGYRVSPEEIAALVRGAPAPGTASPEEIERRMALKGYLDAHDFVLARIRSDFGPVPAVSQSFIRELYAHLFSPSVEAGLLDTDSLVRYRNHPVFLRGSRFVPPNEAKVAALMDCLAEEVSRVRTPAARAVLAHYALVTVHPYGDGNGRLARFLMNYVLCASGAPWITIRADDRETYFRALETAQVDGDILPFAGFAGRYLSEARHSA